MLLPLQQHVRRLYATLKDSSQFYVDQSSIIADVATFCQDAASQGRLPFGQAANVLFDEGGGLFVFVDGLVTSPQGTDAERVSAQKRVFEFVSSFVRMAGAELGRHYALLIKTRCLDTFRRSKSQTVKAATLPPIIQILMLASTLPGLSPEALGVQDMLQLFYKSASNPKQSDGQHFRADLYQTLGALAEYFPGELTQENAACTSAKLQQLFLSLMNAQRGKKSPQETVIGGLLRAIAAFMQHFGGSVDEGAEEWLKPMYQFMARALSVDAHMTRYDVPKGALRLLELRAYQFKEYLTVDAENMYARVRALCLHRNDEVRKAAFPAAQSFFANVALELMQGRRHPQDNRKTYERLLREMRLLLDSRHGPHEVSLGIMACGTLAAPIARYSGPDDLLLVFHRLFVLCTRMYSRSQEDLEDSVRFLPTFLTAFANFVHECGTVPAAVLDDLEAVVNIVFLVYPTQSMFPKVKYATCDALVRLLVALHLKHRALDAMLPRLVYRGLTLTISGSQVFGGDAQAAPEAELGLHEEYFPMWRHLLNPQKLQPETWGWSWAEIAFGSGERAEYLAMLHDAVLDTLMKLAAALDLTCRPAAAGPAEAGEELQYGRLAVAGGGVVVPSNRRDFELYLNLVEFTCRFLRQCSPRQHFLRWAFVLCKRLVEQSNRHPHVSGFFKVLEACVRLCDQYRYFQGVAVRRDARGDPVLLDRPPLYPGPSDSSDDEIEEIGASPPDVSDAGTPEPATQASRNKAEAWEGHEAEVRSCYTLLHQFLHVCLQRIGEYKGDLLAACLRFVLALPLKCINIRTMMGPLQASFGIGLSYPAMAEVGLDAVERWMATAPAVVAECLRPAMPLLQDFLKVSADSSADVAVPAEGDAEQRPQVQPVSKAKGQPKTTIATVAEARDPRRRPAARASELEKTVSDADALYAIQVRVIRLMGRMGPASRERATHARQQDLRQSARWDPQDRVLLVLPAKNLNVELYLDSLLPRVTDLALHAGDRRTKVAACELLHGAALYMLGANANTSQPQQFWVLYRRLFPALLQLAVDPEQVARQLFDALVFQIIHWLTKNQQPENPETMALLDSVMDGLAAPTEGALRELCARCLEHFQRYSLKAGRRHYEHNLRSLYSRLYSMALHPNVWKRLGASVALNKLYTGFREHDDLVSLHGLEMVRVAVRSLAMADDDDPGVGTVVQWQEFLGHLERIVFHKSELLTHEVAERGEIRDLAQMVAWLWAQCARVEAPCRETAMRLFATCCGRLVGFESEDGPRRWLQWWARARGDARAALVAQCDGVITRRLEDVPLQQIQTITYESYVKWARELETCLHVYKWMFGQRFLSPHEVFGGAAPPSPGPAAKRPRHEPPPKRATSKLFAHVHYFVYHATHPGAVPFNVESQMDDFFSQAAPAAAGRGGETETRPLPLSPLQERTYADCKRRVVERLAELVVLLCREFPETTHRVSGPTAEWPLLSPLLYRALFCVALVPDGVGYDTTETRAELHSLALAHRALGALKDLFAAPALDWAPHQRRFRDELRHFLADPARDLMSAELIHRLCSGPAMSVTGATFLVRGYRLLHVLGLLVPNSPRALAAEDLAASLATTLSGLPPTADPVVVLIATELWSLCFALGLPAQTLLDYLLDPTPSEAAAALDLDGASFVSAASEASLTAASSGGASAGGRGRSRGGGAARTRGQLLYRTYRAEMDEYMLRHSAAFVGALARAARGPGPASAAAAGAPRAPRRYPFTILVHFLDAAEARAKCRPEGSDDVLATCIEQFVKHAPELLAPPGPASGPDHEPDTLRLLKGLLRVAATPVLQPDSPALQPVVFAVTRLLRGGASGPGTLLTCTHPQLQLFVGAMEEVPALLAHAPPDWRPRIIAELRRLVVDELPVTPAELPPHSAQYENYLEVVEQILKTLASSASGDLLSALLPLFRSKTHPLHAKMHRALLDLFGTLTPPAMHAVADTCVVQFQDEALPIDVREASVQRIGLCVLARLSREETAEFYARHAEHLLHIITARVNTISRHEDDVAASYTTKICAFNLLEAMYRLLPSDVIRDTVNPHCVPAGTAPNGKELAEAVMRAAHDARAHRPPPTPGAADGAPNAPLLRYRQAALNCLAAALLCTHQKEKLVTKCLFADNRKADLYEHIVDLHHRHAFPVMTSYRYARDAVHRLRADWEGLEGEAAPGLSRTSNRLKYLSSQYLQDSSLSQAPNMPGAFFVHATATASLPLDEDSPEVAPVDPKGKDTPRKRVKVVVPGSPDSPGLVAGRRSMEDLQALTFEGSLDRAGDKGGDGGAAAAGSGGSQESEDSDIGLLEMDDVNANPCMPMYLRVVDYLDKTFRPVPTAEGAPRPLPSWMSEMLQKLSDAATPLNVRLFLTKVILNRPAVFRPHCGTFLGPLLRLAVAPDNGGSGFHYFLRDICLCVLEWDVGGPLGGEAEHLASALIEKLMKEASSDKRFILANNLEIIKMLIEKWGGRIHINKKIILGWLDYDLGKPGCALARITGLQLMGVVLANGYPAYDRLYDEHFISEERLYDKLLQNLRFEAAAASPAAQAMGRERRKIWEATGEVVGMALANLSAASTSAHDKTETLLTKMCAELKAMHDQLQHDRFLAVLDKAGLHYEPLLDHFLPTPVVNLLPRLQGQTRVLALQIVYKRARHVADLYKAFGPSTAELLEHRDEACQTLIVQIIHRILPTLAVDDVEHFMALVARLIAAQSFGAVLSETTRSWVYDIWVWLYDNRPHDLARHLPRLTRLLLSGLSDASLAIRTKVLEFWNHETRLPLDAMARLERLFVDLYDDARGEAWLQYAAYLLLKLTQHADADYENKTGIWKNSLDKCDFREMPIQTAWQFRSLPMTPMFSLQNTLQTAAGSLASAPQSLVAGAGDAEGPASAFDDDDAEPYGTAQPRRVLATQAYQFPGTMPDGAALPFAATQGPLSTQTAMLFVPFHRPLGAGGGAPAGGSSQGSQGQQRLRRRYVKQPESQETKMHILRAARLKRERDLFEVRHRLDRQNCVQMMRTYRAGELPDIQISRKELIEPMAALCMRDVPLASLVFTALFDAVFPKICAVSPHSHLTSSVVTHVPERPTAHKRDEAIGRHIGRILTVGAAVPSVVAFLHNACLSHAALRVDPGVVFASALRSNNLRSGVLLLEKAVARAAQPPGPGSGPGSGYGSMRATPSCSLPSASQEGSVRPPAPVDVQRMWLELACLYKELGEHDVVRMILAEHLTLQTGTKAALEKVLHGDHAGALKLISAALEEHAASAGPGPGVAAQEVELWQHERLVCLQKLMQWDDLAYGAISTAVALQDATDPTTLISLTLDADLASAAAGAEVTHADALWRRLPLLTMWLKGNVRDAGGDGLKQVNEFWKLSQTSLARREWLESHCPAELAFCVACGDGRFDEALHYVRLGYRHFLRQQSSVAPHAPDGPGAGALLGALQALTEMEEALELLVLAPTPGQGPYAARVAARFRRLCKAWQSRRPGASEAELEVWDDLLHIRQRLLGHVESHVRRVLEDADSPPEGAEALDVRRHVTEELSRMFLSAARAARGQGRVAFCHEYLKKCQDLRKQAQPDGKGPFQAAFYAEIIRMLQAKVRQKGLSRDADQLLQYIRRNGRDAEAADAPLHWLLMADTHRTFAEVMKERPDFLPSDIKSRADALGGAFEYYHKAMDQAPVAQAVPQSQPPPPTAAAVPQTVSDALLKFSLFCDDLLRELTDADPAAAAALTRGPRALPDARALAEAATEALLRATALGGGTAARQRFPRVLELLAAHPTTHAVFARLAARVPCNAMVAWVSQILGHLNGPHGDVLVPVLQRLARHYRQELFYAYNVVRDDLRPREGLAQLQAALEDSELQRFVHELELLHSPDLRFKDWFTAIYTALTQRRYAGAQSLWAQCCADCLGAGDAAAGAAPGGRPRGDPPQRRGTYNDKFAAHWGPVVRGRMQGIIDGSAQAKDPAVELFKQYRAVAEEMKKWVTRAAEPSDLPAYSYWLADYRVAADSTNYILLPTQAFFDACPDTLEARTNSRIMSFDLKLLTMKSIQKPKRLKIHCSNEQVHMYLVKGGEDLRLDQRIEQIFSVMNSVMPHKRARVRTYSVVPLSKKVGIIEWVPNTTPLKAVLEGVATQDAAGHKISAIDLMKEKYVKFMTRSAPVDYLLKYLSTAKDVVQAMQDIMATAPSDLLARGLHSLCTSQQAFFQLRKNFVASLAVTNTFQYVVGIGDRHQDNFLIDETTGQIIPIDFGRAFGYGAEAQPVPELIPFRLTNQMLNVLQPLGVQPLLRADMIACMKALHANQRIILDTLEVFVHEPLMEWVAEVQKEKGRLGGSDESETKPRYPKEKLTAVEMKLNHYHPVPITAQELDRNTKVDKTVQKVRPDIRNIKPHIKKVLIGDRASLRAKCLPTDADPHGTLESHQCADIAQQIDCLIDQATDLTILGRTWIGWMPFL